MFLRNTGDILVILWYFFLYSTRLKARGIQKKIPQNCSNIHRYFMKTHGITGKYGIFYCQFSSPLCYEREGVFTNKQYRFGCSISIKMGLTALWRHYTQQADTMRVFIANYRVGLAQSVASPPLAR